MHLYILIDGTESPCGPCKIGIATNLSKRLSTYLTGSPGRSLRYHQTWETDRAKAVEQTILAHAKIMGLRGRGEWLMMRPQDVETWIEDELTAGADFGV